MRNAAFVGVSLDSSLFSREWIRGALSYLLAKHDEVLFVLADQLLVYNKVPSLAQSSPGTIDLDSAKARINQRREDIRRFIAKEIGLLPKEIQDRVRIKTWDDFADCDYIRLLRKLRIAYCVIPEFRECVDHDATFHFERHSDVAADQGAYHELCVSYVLDETAMDIRITESGTNPFEYYPVEHIRTLTLLYEDRFAAFGLTVSKLIGRSPMRIFQRLPLIHEAAVK